MVSIAKAAELIEANYDLAGFVGGVPFEEVWVAEGRLGVTFPESYREFLQKFGAGSFGGVTIFGLRSADFGLRNEGPVPVSDAQSEFRTPQWDVVWATEAVRQADDFFPGDLVVIQDTGEGDLLCLATSRMRDGECPVVQWIPELSFEEQGFEVVNSTFAHFLLRVARKGIA